MAKSYSHEDYPDPTGHVAVEDTTCEKPLSAAEREEIIQYIISTQMIEGIEVDYDTAAAMVDKAYERPLRSLDSI